MPDTSFEGDDLRAPIRSSKRPLRQYLDAVRSSMRWHSAASSAV